jgi:phage shock protein PspC (stress-responsive transcriptional regulator)
MNLPDDLQKLHTLHEQGGLTDEEFTQAKKRLLEQTTEDARPRARQQCEPSSSLNQFRRSDTDRWIGGVCGGLAEVTGIPAWSWRILFVLTACLHGIGLLMYILLWIFVPLQTMTPRPAAPPAP